MDAIPGEAWTSPIANDNQKCRYYLNGVKQHVVVPRVA
jgi:hypothetical protein